jgi:hypothetical protein
MRRRRYYAVDRIEDDLVVLIDDHGTGLVVPDSRLPAGAREGQVFTVIVDNNGQPDWTTATHDEPEERRRLEEAKARLERLKRRGDG